MTVRNLILLLLLNNRNLDSEVFILDEYDEPMEILSTDLDVTLEDEAIIIKAKHYES